MVVTVKRADKKIAFVSSDSDTVSIINERKIKRTNKEREREREGERERERTTSSEN